MRRVCKTIFSVFVLMFALSFGLLRPVAATGEIQDICAEFNCDSGGGENADICAASGCTTDTDAGVFVNNLFSVILGLVGLIAIGVMIFGGIMYATSTGDAAKVQRAKHIIMYGIIGFGVAMLAYAIVLFITKAING